jgi:ribosome-associated heat shock protein Hsp15
MFLWCARVARQRSVCAEIARSGLVRINRQPTDKPHAKVRPGDVLTLPWREGVRVVRVVAVGDRRGPAEVARTLYEEVSEISISIPALPPAE